MLENLQACSYLPPSFLPPPDFQIFHSSWTGDAVLAHVQHDSISFCGYLICIGSNISGKKPSFAHLMTFI